ncbi:developmentally-regulated protein [Acrasis kona]|uniref:Developmentally-regulated protein n=1 Tax=Acrasis kona TaxID=1008807 RepID=A0AAW2ZNB4_9EUKA
MHSHKQEVPVAQTTQTTVTTKTTETAPAVTNVVHKDAIVTNVVDKAVLGNVIEKQNIEVVHKPVVQEIHEQKIIELEKQNVVKNIKQDTVVQRATDQTRYEEIGNKDLEAERLRLAQLNATKAPVVTRQSGATHEVREGEVVAQVVRQEHIEHHVQPVITEVREQNIVKEVLHPVVRKVHEETIVREVGSSTVHSDLFLTWEKNMYGAYQKDTNGWNREKWLLANPQPVGYKPTGFFNQYPSFSQYHTTTVTSAPLLTNANQTHLAWEKSMYNDYEKHGSSWNRDSYLKANPQPTGYQPTGFLNQYSSFSQFHHTNVVDGGKLPKKPTDLSKVDGPINPVAVVNPSENLKHQPTDGTVVPTTTLGEAPAHTHEVLKGAAAGAAIGSVVPVVGTVVGGVIGAIGGAIVKQKHIKEGTHAFKE